MKQKIFPKTALFSVSNKKGLIPFAAFLEKNGTKIIASGGTARVLKKNGVAILQVPIDESLSKTFEDKTILDPKKKSELFGQYDHVRKYGKDYYDRLKSVGFKVKKIDIQKKLSEEEIKKYCLPKYEKIPFVIKN